MKEESHNHWIDPDLETRIVALVLGEASDLERDQLNRLIEQRPELAAIKEQFQCVHELMRDVGAGESVAEDADWKLSAEKRRAILAVMSGTVNEQPMKLAVSKPAEGQALTRANFFRSLTKIAAVFCVAGFFGLMAIASFGVRAARETAYLADADASDAPALLEESSPSSRTSWMDRAENIALSETESPTTRPAAVTGLDYANDSKSALSDIRDSLGADVTRPSPYYLQDEVQYIPATSEHSPPSDGAAMGEAGGGDKQTSDNYAVMIPDAPSSGASTSSDALGVDNSAYAMSGFGDAQESESGGETPGVSSTRMAESGQGRTDQEGKSEGFADIAAIALGYQESGPGQGASEGLPRGRKGATFRFSMDPMESQAVGKGIAVDELMESGDGVVDGRRGFDANGSMMADALRSKRKRLENSSLLELSDSGIPAPAIAVPENEQMSSREDLQKLGDLADTGSGKEERTNESVMSGDDDTAILNNRIASDDSLGGLQAGRAEQDVTSMLRRHERKITEGKMGDDREKIVNEKQSTSGAWATRINREWLEKLTSPQSESMRTAAAEKSVAPAGLNESNAENEAFSTFSLHVSDVSFKLARAALARGEWPEAAKVRIEEFVNAFDYGDPMPSHSEKVACRVEQSIHPFLQQRNLLRVSMRTAAAGRASNTPLRLTFLLDNSGSMERIDRQQTVRHAFALLAQQLKPIDQVTLISFARQPRLLADKVSGAQSQQLVGLIDDLPSEGGTNIEAALQLAFEKAQEQQADGSQNRIVLLTDGAVNLGDAKPESLSRMITTIRDAGIAFDAAGISAEGLNDEILEALTRKGDGRYYLLDSLEAADEGFARQIAGALRPSAKNVKVQVEFNPKRVGRYKLLGFEKHLLKPEDFRNDRVDAAEMAAAEAGVAVYQFEAKPDGEGDVGSVSVRFRDLSTGQMIENRWPIPYQGDAPRCDQAAPSLRIATSAALLAAKLRGKPLGETVNLKTLSDLISGLPDRDRNAKRVQQLQRMIGQARQVSGN